MSAPASILCVIPGLVWPAAGLSEILAPLALPGLSALLAQSEIHHEAPCSLDVWLAGQFGLSGPLPFAALRLAGEQGDAAVSGAEISLVCADPVSLRFARQHLLLDAPETLELNADETTALLGDLNKTFADVGEFHCTVPEHCYLTLNAEHADKLGVTLAPLADVESRPVAQFQPKGEQAEWWSRLSNELQVFCHNHAVNTAREARGAPALNALWLWGVGRARAMLTPPSSQMAIRSQHVNPILEGLAKFARKNLEIFDPRNPAEWALLNDLHAAAQQRNATHWATCLQTLDTEVFTPLSDQLRDSRITRLRICSPGDTALTHFDISPPPRWKFWQRGVSKAQLVSRLGSPDTQP